MMLPVMINLETSKILLIGQGAKLHAREAKLNELGASNLDIKYQMSDVRDFSVYDVVMVVDLPEEQCAKIYKAAKAAHCMVNVEDNKKYCDFFFQSFVRRGKLLISISTNGSSPGTAKIIRDKINDIFPPEWEQYIDVAAKRAQWKQLGKSYDEVNELTKQYVADKNWL